LTKAKSTRAGIIEWFSKHPLVGALGSLSSIIGLVIALFVLYTSDVQPRLSYAINPIRTTILRNDVTSDLKVLHKGRKITDHLTAVQIAIWNSGKQFIEMADTVQALKIVSSPKVPILELNVKAYKKIDRKRIIGFSYSDSIFDLGKVPISWRILAKDDAVLLQLIYEGPDTIGFSIEGALKEQPMIENVTKAFEPNQVLITVIILLFLMVLTQVIPILYKWIKFKKSSTADILTLIAVLSLFSLSVIWFLGRFSTLGIPFSF